MLWSLLKVLIFIAIVAGLAFGVGYLTEVDDVALLTVAGREFALTPIVAIFLSLVLLLSVWLLFKAVGLIVATLRFLNGDETAISRYFNRRAERKGFEALAEGMMALAAGEGRLAIRKAERAEQYLKRPSSPSWCWRRAPRWPATRSWPPRPTRRWSRTTGPASSACAA
jgi:HemY protein